MARLTLSEQLTAAQVTIQALNAQVAVLQSDIRAVEATTERAERLAAEKLATVTAEFEKKLKDKDQSYTYQSSSLTEARNEIEQAHAVLDGVEGSPTRDYEKEGAYGKVQRNVVTRLAGAFLAIARNGGVK